MGAPGGSHIIIGAQRVKVKVSPTLEESYGEADLDRNEITIAAGLAPGRAVDTLLHEVVHFMLASLPLDDKDDEYLAGIIGRGFTSLLRDNPEWVKRVLKILEKESCQTKSIPTSEKAETPAASRRKAAATKRPKRKRRT